MRTEEDFIQNITVGMKLLGWQFSSNQTNEENALIESICNTAIDLKNRDLLTPDKEEELSSNIYTILKYKFLYEDVFADLISLVFENSMNLKQLLPLLDESVICFLSGCYTASLSLGYIVLEKYLRNIHGWKNGDQDPKFYELKNSIKKLPNTQCADIAYDIVDIIYSRYDSINPSKYEFNRHGLLHGIKSNVDYDEMNYVRLFYLFNTLCYAENINRTGYGKCLDHFNQRKDIYDNSTYVNIFKNRIEIYT